MKKNIKAFISYSHEDRVIAINIADNLRANGIEAWIDQYEILPGDSLIKKIFEEGLQGADVFIILLSNNSVESKWVKQELDVATIKRIDGLTRIIPIRLDNVKVPNSLLALKWIDFSNNPQEKTEDLIHAIFEIREKPAIGPGPVFLEKNSVEVGGISQLATNVGRYFVTSGSPVTGNEESVVVKDLAEKLALSPKEIDDALDELENFGLVKTHNYLGSSPFSHSEVESTYALFLIFKSQGLDYDPEEDIKIVASAIVSQEQIDGKRIMELTGLSPLRINRAVGFLEDYGIVKVFHEIGTREFDFGFILATWKTRQFVEENCK
jgi:DNA-binding transcriptional regulator GbsR (MarR family)